MSCLWSFQYSPVSQRPYQQVWQRFQMWLDLNLFDRDKDQASLTWEASQICHCWFRYHQLQSLWHMIHLFFCARHFSRYHMKDWVFLGQTCFSSRWFLKLYHDFISFLLKFKSWHLIRIWRIKHRFGLFVAYQLLASISFLYHFRALFTLSDSSDTIFRHDNLWLTLLNFHSFHSYMKR